MIFRSLFVIAAVAAIAGAGTYSLWNSQASITGNTFSAGTMDIKIDSNLSSSGFTWVSTFENTLAKFSNLYPGFTSEPMDIDIRNIGTIDGKVTFDISRTAGVNELSDNLRFNVYYDEHLSQEAGTFGTPIIKGATLSQILTWDPILLGDLAAAPDGSTTPDGTKIATVRIVWYVPTSAGNNIQGDSVTLNMIVGLNQ